MFISIHIYVHKEMVLEIEKWKVEKKNIAGMYSFEVCTHMNTYMDLNLNLYIDCNLYI
jgi:hypothetical protein